MLTSAKKNLKPLLQEIQLLGYCDKRRCRQQTDEEGRVTRGGIYICSSYVHERVDIYHDKLLTILSPSKIIIYMPIAIHYINLVLVPVDEGLVISHQFFAINNCI